MGITKPSPKFQVGDRGKIHYSDWRGRIVEFRGPLGVGGAFVYRVRIPGKPPRYIELPEDELTAIPTKPKAKPSPDGTILPKETTADIPFFRKGDHVEIRGTNWQGRVTELRIPSIPGGAYVYRVRVPAEPRSIYVELSGNYLVAVPSRVKKGTRPSGKRRVRDEQKGK